MAAVSHTRPVFRQFVVKIASRCDLACNHCYVYEHADQSWRNQPRFMSAQTVERTIERIAEHCQANSVAGVRIVLHGGEPLLAGPERILRLARAAAGLRQITAVDLRIQTNGVLLDEAFCDLFAGFGIKVGISLDGDRASNDRHRVFRDGRSSYESAAAGIRLLQRPAYRHLYAGLLCTIDLANTPEHVYTGLAEFDPPAVEFLLPHANWTSPPYQEARSGAAPYAQWLLTVYRRWHAEGEPFPIRIFESIMSQREGGPSFTEALGSEPADVVVIETDGAIELPDSLKSAYNRAPHTGCDINSNTFDDAAVHPGFAARIQGVAALSAQCRRCDVVEICGGGLYAHRFGADGFDHPSVYCADLYELITSLPARQAPTLISLTGTQFDELACGRGGPGALEVLRSAQVSVRKAKLRGLLSRCSQAVSRAVIGAIENAPGELLDRLLADPFSLNGPSAAETVTDIAAACADGGKRAAVRTADFGAGRVVLEDSDPRRDCFGPGHRPADRLDAESVARWRREIDVAASILSRRHPETFTAMTSSLAAIVPLRPNPGSWTSATSRYAFGAIGLALPGEVDDEPGEVVAKLLLHEFQYMKVGAVLDLFELHDGSDSEARYKVAWQADPQPLEEALQGTYAHLAVAFYWEQRAAAVDPAAFEHLQHAARIAGWIDNAAQQISRSPALTPLGRRWLDRLCSALPQRTDTALE